MKKRIASLETRIEEEIKKMPIENTPKEKEEFKDAEKEATKKMFPFMIRTIYPKMIL